MGRLDGKIGIVTGASSGIGHAVAKALAAEGVVVYMLSRSAESLAAAAKDVPGAICVPTDVTKRESVHAAVAKVMSDSGKIDIAVSCAGVMYFTLMKNKNYDQWEQTIDTNCKGVVNMSGAVLPHMLSAGCGHIINISSDAARTIFPALAVYNASKAFVSTFSKGLRAECVGTGLRVTDVQPGDVATNLIMKNTDEEAASKVGVAIGKVVGDGGDKSSVLDASDVADVVVYAATAPRHVGMHEVLVEPRDQMFGDPTAMTS